MRSYIEAVLWIVRTGSPWRDLPREFGKWNSVFRHYRRRSKAERFTGIFAEISGEADREFGVLPADKAFDADWPVKDLTERGSKVVIPPRSNRKPAREYDREMYKWRHLVENFFCKLNGFKKAAMRAEKTDISFSANIYLTATHRPTIMSTAPKILPKRWIVERSFSWLEKNRRLWKNGERKLSTGLQMVVSAFFNWL